jgi:hypothetical protein
MAKYLSAVGVKLRIISPATSGGVQHEDTDGEYSAYEVYVESFPMKILYAAGFAAGGVVNYFDATDKELDELDEKAAVADDPTPYLTAMSRRIVDQAMQVPIFHEGSSTSSPGTSTA